MAYNIWYGLSRDDRDYFNSAYERREQFILLTGLFFEPRVADIPDVFEPNSLNDSIGSTITLINHIQHLQNEADLDQLVFLDRSGRLGAHMMRRAWRNLQARGEIDPTVSLPKSTFVNVGRSNSREDDFDQTVRCFGSVLSDATDAKTILVVDDYSSTGGSIKNTMDLYAKEGRLVFGTSQLRYQAPWYANKSPGLKGTVELGDTMFARGKLPECVRNLDTKTARKLAASAQNTNQRDFVENLFETGDILELELGLHTSVNLFELGELYLWAKSLGGLVVLPYGADEQNYTRPQTEQRHQTHDRYRRLINACVDGYFALRDEALTQTDAPELA